ncbi:MAG: FecR domain-containing protein [Planctomycetaceae bacterium]
MKGDSEHWSRLLDEVYELAHSVLEGHATDSQRERLEQLVLEDDDACKAYIQYMHETVVIRQLVRAEGAAPKVASVIVADEDCTRHEIGPAFGASGKADSASRETSRSSSSFSSGAPIRPSRPGVVGSWLYRRRMALALGGAIVAAVFIAVLERSEPAGTKTAEQDLRVVRTERVARLKRSVDAIWSSEGNSASLQPGDWLTHGRYSLTQGFAQIRFAWGTEVTLEAPVEIEFVPDGTRRLLFGTLVARVSPDDTDFTVDTPTVKVVDLGTEFGVSTAHSGESEVHVFKGAVEARQKLGDAAELSRPIKLSAGEATGFGIQKTPSRPITYNPKRFSKAWRVASRVSETTGAMRFIHPPPASVVEGRTESNENLLLFLESEAVILTDPVAVTITQPGLYTTTSGSGARLPAGIAVDSFLVHFDPVGSKFNQAPVTAQGTVTFERPIVGIIARGDQLAESDRLFAAPDTHYVCSVEYEFQGPIDDGYFTNHLPPYSIRGLAGLWSAAELHDSPAPNDWIRLSADRRTLTVTCSAGGEADQLRILVAAAVNESVVTPQVPDAVVSYPYRGRPFRAGDVVQAEDYDLGGEGVGYHDNTPDALANVYRTNSSVELYSYVVPGRTETVVCMATPGEWLAYTVDIDKPGTYIVKARVGGGRSLGGSFRFDFGETLSTAPLHVPESPQTGGFPPDHHVTIESAPVRLEPGRHVMRVVMNTNSDRRTVGDFDWFQIEPLKAEPTATARTKEPIEQ